MKARDKAVVDLALQLLRETVEAKQPPLVETVVRLALRVLLPHCPESWPLTGFWDGMHGSNEIGRHQTMNASLNGIMVQLRKNGWTDK